MNINAFNPYLIHMDHLNYCRHINEMHDPFPARTTKWHEIDIITYGHGTDVVNGNEYKVETGDVFYRTPGVNNIHYRPYYCYFFVFDPQWSAEHEEEYLFDILGEMNLNAARREFADPIPVFSFADKPYLGKLTNIEEVLLKAIRLQHAYDEKRCDTLLIKTLFMNLLLELREQLAHPLTEDVGENRYSKYNTRIEDLMTFIREHPNREYTLNSMASDMMLSKNFFTKVFASVSGTTPLAYVRNVKLNQIKSLLLDTEMNVSEVARECNVDENYIYVLFRHAMKMTPLEYRRKNGIIHGEKTDKGSGQKSTASNR